VRARRVREHAGCLVWACRKAGGAERAGVKLPGHGFALLRRTPDAARAACVRLGPSSCAGGPGLAAGERVRLDC